MMVAFGATTPCRRMTAFTLCNPRSRIWRGLPCIYTCSRHGISRPPEVDDDKPGRQRFRRYPIGIFHIDSAEAQTTEGKPYLCVAIDRTSKEAAPGLVGTADRMTA